MNKLARGEYESRGRNYILICITELSFVIDLLSKMEMKTIVEKFVFVFFLPCMKLITKAVQN